MIINYYQILEIEDYSSVEIVKKSFRKLALIYHPDLNHNIDTNEKFKNLVKAYQILSNTDSKRKYDESLKNGFDYSDLYNSLKNAETERESRKYRYYKMKKEKDELEEIENIASYEKSIKIFPFKFRLIMIFLAQVSGIFLMLNDWFAKGSFIAFGAIVFFISSITLWNELYKFYWHKCIFNKDEKLNSKYDKSAYSYFIRIFSGGIFILIVLIYSKKAWHLNQFGTYVFAKNNYQYKILVYEVNNKQYLKKYIFISDSLKFKDQVLIKVSSKEPDIWEFAY